MTIDVLKKNVSKVVQELIDKGFTNISINEHSNDIWVIIYS